MSMDAAVDLFSGGPRASTAVALWKARVAVTSDLYDEVQTLKDEGYMLTEIAKLFGVDRQTLTSVLGAETTRRRYRP